MSPERTRSNLCGRIHALRSALGLLWSQTETDGAMPYRTISTAKVELIQPEQQLRDLDAAERGQPMSDFARDLLLAPPSLDLLHRLLLMDFGWTLQRPLGPEVAASS